MTAFQHKKYRLIGYAYRVFLIGLTTSLLAFAVEFVRHSGHA